jgi:hypothetical protein
VPLLYWLRYVRPDFLLLGQRRPLLATSEALSRCSQPFSGGAVPSDLVAADVGPEPTDSIGDVNAPQHEPQASQLHHATPATRTTSPATPSNEANRNIVHPILVLGIALLQDGLVVLDVLDKAFVAQCVR